MGDEVKVYFCPECESTDVKYVFGFMNLFGTIPMKECGDCNLRAPTFPMLIAKKSILEEMENRKKARTKKSKKKRITAKVSSKTKKINKKSGVAVVHTPKKRSKGAKR
ncbi:MAG: hypothetical protein IH845_03750 [Nanoarchaeota archaeon]|nr:hypothetical protein [Nanoarchaeota archaeon]